jgi:hypothetical protein
MLPEEGFPPALFFVRPPGPAQEGAEKTGRGREKRAFSGHNGR